MVRIAILTGANRGLGKRTAEILVEKYSDNFVYIFTERSNNHEELNSSLLKINPKANFEIRDLDISVKESRAKFLEWFKQKYHHVDVLFNNAGVFNKDDSEKRPTRAIAEFTLNINFFDTIDFTEEVYPLLSDDGRILEMSSLLGQLSFQPEQAKKVLSDETLNKEKLQKLAHDYIQKTDDANSDLIFTNYAYHTSKALLTAYVRFVGAKNVKPNQSIISVHPGWVQTDMGGKNAPMTMEEACPDLAKYVAEYQFGRHPHHGKLIFQNKDIGF